MFKKGSKKYRNKNKSKDNSKPKKPAKKPTLEELDALKKQKEPSSSVLLKKDSPWDTKILNMTVKQGLSPTESLVQAIDYFMRQDFPQDKKNKRIGRNAQDVLKGLADAGYKTPEKKKSVKKKRKSS